MNRMKAFGATTLASVMMLGTMTATSGAAYATTTTPEQTLEQSVDVNANHTQIQDIFFHINEFRASKNLEPLNFNVYVSEMSQSWSEQMAETGVFEHNSGSYFAQIDSRAHGWNGAGEIIAARWDRSGEEIVKQWIASPAHNANMSDPDWTTMGIGVAFGDPENPERNTMYGTVNFLDYSRTTLGTYSNPADYFAGQPALPVMASPAAPSIYSDSYTIPQREGVQYQVNGELKEAGNYEAAPGTYTINAVPAEGYAFIEGATSQWSFEVAAQIIKVTATAPVFADGEYTLPAVEGLEYSVNGTVKNAGTYQSDKKVTVTAAAVDGYSLTGTSSWSHDFTPVVIEVAPIKPVYNSKKGTYTIPSVEGVQYVVEGKVKTPGNYKTDASNVDIRPVALPGYQLTYGTMWNLLFINPAPGEANNPPAPEKEYTAPKNPMFEDVDRDTKFYKEISWLAEYGVSKGWDDGTFRPRADTNRDAMAAFLYRMAGKPAYTPPKHSPFKDVDEDYQFYKEISWLAESGISKGWDDGTFRPHANTNRDAMAAFMYRMAGKPAYEAPRNSEFKDVDHDTKFYKEISWLAESGISKGWDDNTFRPQSNTNRDAMAAFLFRYYHGVLN